MSQATQRVKKFELDPSELDRRVEAAMGGIDLASLTERLSASIAPVLPGAIVQARVDSVDQRSGMVVLDIGGKSEGSIPIAEFGDTLPVTGETYEVYYDGLARTTPPTCPSAVPTACAPGSAWPRSTRRATRCTASAGARSRAACWSTWRA